MLLNPSLDHNLQQNPCTARIGSPVLSCEKASAKPQQSPSFPRALPEVCFKTLPFPGQPLSGPILVHHKVSGTHPVISVDVFWQNLSQTGITGRLKTSPPLAVVLLHLRRQQALRGSAAAPPCPAPQALFQIYGLADPPGSLSDVFSVKEFHHFTVPYLLLMRFLIKVCH